MIILLAILLIFLAAILAILLWQTSITFYYAVDDDGTACFFFSPPVRDGTRLAWYPTDNRGFIEAGALSRELPHITWADEPIKVSLIF